MGGALLFNAGFNMTKCFLQNPEKNIAQIRAVVFDKNAKIA